MWIGRRGGWHRGGDVRMFHWGLIVGFVIGCFTGPLIIYAILILKEGEK